MLLEFINNIQLLVIKIFRWQRKAKAALFWKSESATPKSKFSKMLNNIKKMILNL